MYAKNDQNAENVLCMEKTHELAGVSTFGCALKDNSLVCRSNPPPATGSAVRCELRAR